MDPESFVLAPNGWVPNSRYPVLAYRQVLPAAGGDETAARLEALFAGNGWPPSWRNGVFAFHHYHSTAHEVLGIASGSAQLVLGGPGGSAVKVSGGDVLLLPAGTGHFQVEASRDFLVVGAYPPGQRFDICREAPSDEALRRMARLGRPATDPVGGGDGPLLQLWPLDLGLADAKVQR